MHAKVRSYVYEQINVLFFLLNVPPITRMTFPVNWVASLAVRIFNVSSCHNKISYVELES